jgi:hypothetical protein
MFGDDWLETKITVGMMPTVMRYVFRVLWVEKNFTAETQRTLRDTESIISECRAW